MKHYFLGVDIFWIYFLGYDFGMSFLWGVLKMSGQSPLSDIYQSILPKCSFFWYLRIKKQGISSASMSLLIL